jgi:hypothetical protein
MATVTGTFKVIRKLTKAQVNKVADALGMARTKLRGVQLIGGAGRKKRRKARKSAKTGRTAGRRGGRRRRRAA